MNNVSEKVMEEDKIRYLEAIQGTINRMASNSFAIKNWFVVLFGGLLTIFFKQHEIWVPIVGIVITIFFATQDAYYLYLERSYRNLYALALKDEVELFDMDTTKVRTHVLYVKSFGSFSIIIYFVSLLCFAILLFIK
ncbi:MAG: hypothetical protein LBU35_03055 [Holosporales bacterium]|jgi:hypothetical protein|nr:hypothetical protein [Holosporales bacterium]